MELRDYQIECIDRINNEMKLSEKCIVEIATGGGKTVVFSSLVNQYYNEGKRCLIVVDQTELKLQTFLHLKRWIECNDDDIGFIQANENCVDKKIIIATRQTLTHPKSKRIEEMLKYGDFELIIFDECHRAVNQIDKILKKIPYDKAKVLGFSATPYNKDMTIVFDRIIYTKDIYSLIQEGYLVDFKYMMIDTNISLDNIQVRMNEFVQYQLAKQVNTFTRNEQIVDSYLEYGENKQAIVFCVDIQHSIDIADTFKEKGISCKSLTSLDDNNDRGQVLKDFKDGKIQVLTNCCMLTTGFNYPNLGCIIMACPTKSKIKYIQCLGRGLRLAEDKEYCICLDLVDNCSSHTLLNARSIFDMEHSETLKESKERKEREKKEKEEREKKEREEREEAERLRLKQIEIFNNDRNNFKEFKNLDWFICSPSDTTVFVLFYDMNKRYYIVPKDGEYHLFNNVQGCIQWEDEGSLLELVEYAEDFAKEKGKGWFYGDARWKKENASPKQITCLSKYYPNLGNISKWGSQQLFEELTLEKFMADIDSYV